MIKRLLAWGFWIVLGLFLLNNLYGIFVTATTLRNYEVSFQQLGHPQETTFVDSFKFKFSYYPATYVDDSIINKCAYLVGEIRMYDNDWDALNEFYNSKTISHDNLENIYVGILPIDIVSNGKLSSSIIVSNRFSYTPFDVDVLEKLRSHYMFWGIPEGIGEGGEYIYAVYITPSCD